MVFLLHVSLCIECIVGLNAYHTSECCFSCTFISSPDENKPNGNYFIENACAQFLSSCLEVVEDERAGVFDTYQGVDKSHS